MPHNDIINKAADKAYEKHSKDNTGLALNSKIPEAPEVEVAEEEEKAELTPAQKAQGANEIIQAAGAQAIEVPEQAVPEKGYALDEYDVAAIEQAAPPVDLFQLYNL